MLGSYLYTLLAFCIVSALVLKLAFNDGARKMLSLSVGLLFFVLAVRPLPELIGQLTSFNADTYFDSLKVEASGSESYLSVFSESYSDGICTIVCERFSLSSSDVEVSVDDFNFDTLSATRVNISLKNSAVFADKYAISEYVFSSVGVLCRVEVLFNE